MHPTSAESSTHQKRSEKADAKKGISFEHPKTHPRLPQYVIFRRSLAQHAPPYTAHARASRASVVRHLSAQNLLAGPEDSCRLYLPARTVKRDRTRLVHPQATAE